METILAESEIRSLLTKERYYRDVGEWEKLRDCYHPDSAETLIKVSWSAIPTSPLHISTK